MSCACGSSLNFENCCHPIIKGQTTAPTAEKLMRARYTAYSQGEISFIKKTLAPEALKGFDSAAAKKWSQEAQWKGLQILSTKNGQPSDKKGTVEFIAHYDINGESLEHHEVAQFRKNDSGEWLFVDGDSHTHKEGEGHQHAKPETVVRTEPKVGRNDPCPCNSGKKYKKCCGSL